MAKIKRAATRLGQIKGAQLTRLAMIMAMFLSLLSTVCSLWLFWAISDASWALRRSGVIPKLDENFDSVAAAGAVGRLDVLSIVVTFVGIVAAIALIYGWTAFRSTARQAAIAEVDEQLPEALAELLEVHGHSLIVQALKDDQLIARLQERFTAIGLADTGAAEEVDTDPQFWEADDVK